MPEQLTRLWNQALTSAPGGSAVTVGQIIQVILLLILGYFVGRIVSYLLGRRLATTRLRTDARHILKRITFFTILLLVFITALSLLGIPLTAFAFATGAIAIGVGFGAQNILNNFMSGWILMAERPIRIDDFVEIDNSFGTVEQIGNRSTRIRRVDGVHMLVPNSMLLERTVINWTLVDEQIRTGFKVGVEYGSPVKRVAELIQQAVEEHEQVKQEPAPIVVFEDFGDNALVFETLFWCDAAGEKQLRQVRSDIRFRICDLFEQNGIVVAFPQRDVHLDSRRPVQIELVGKPPGENPE
jgi:small-conductance mechanosensitive channel